MINQMNQMQMYLLNLKYSRILEYPTLLMCDKTRTFPLLNSHIKYVYKIPCNMVYVYAADLNWACKYIYILKYLIHIILLSDRIYNF